jgi:spore coat protein SA
MTSILSRSTTATLEPTVSIGHQFAVGVLLSGRELFSPYYGGALARWTYEVYSRLPEAVSVTVFGFPTNERDAYPLPHETSKYWRMCRIASCIPVARRYQEKLWLYALLPRLLKLDVMHLHNRPQWPAWLRSLGYRGTILLHLQNDHLGHWTASMLDALAPNVDGVVVCSRFLRDTFAPKSPALAAKTHVIFNGVDTSLFFPKEEIREPKTILFAGRFAAEKGVLQLVQAYAQVLQSHPDARLVIAGSTGFGRHEETAYVRQVRELAESILRCGRGNIQFTGYLHHDKNLPSSFQRATIFASPSLFEEPFGLVNTEAMACATPVVGANRGGIPEVLGDSGRITDPDDIEELAAVFSALLADRRECNRLGRAGYIRCQGFFDWKVISANWLTLLQDIAARRNARTPSVKSSWNCS